VELESLRWVRRAASAAVSLSAIALVMAKTSGPSAAAAGSVGVVASVAFCLSLVLLVVVWRKEHTLNEVASAARERQQLAALRLQAERAKRPASDATEKPSPEGARPSE
jgi:hypothetical protein